MPLSRSRAATESSLSGYMIYTVEPIDDGADICSFVLFLSWATINHYICRVCSAQNASVIAIGTRRVTAAIFMVAGRAFANMSPTATDKDGRLLPFVRQLRKPAIPKAGQSKREREPAETKTPLDEGVAIREPKCFT